MQTKINPMAGGLNWLAAARSAVVIAALAVFPTMAMAANIDITANYTGPANGLDPVNVPGGNWSTNNLRLGAGATAKTIIINGGTLSGTDNGDRSFEILGTSNVVTFTGSSTVVTVNSRMSWSTGSVKISGTGNTMNVLAGAQFRANGWNGLDGSGNTITVDGAGSVAGFCVEYSSGGAEDGNDGFGNTSSGHLHNKVNVTNGGLVHVGDNGLHGFTYDTAGQYTANVDGTGGRSTFRFAQLNDCDAGGGGIVHVFNGGAMETDDFHGQNPNTWSIQGGIESKFFIDGGVLS